MSRKPSNQADDPTSLGSILVAMGTISPDSLKAAVEMQERLSTDELLGKLLVAEGGCTQEQVAIALSAQDDMRSRDKSKQALAVASIAQIRKAGTNGARQHLISKAEGVTRKATGQAHPAITPEMLSAKADRG